MKALSTILSCLFFALALSAQGQNADEDLNRPKAEPYPAPISYANISQLEAWFLALFRSENVSNLHVHAIPDTDKNDYTYEGTPIGPEFSGLLTPKMAAQTSVKGQEPRAVLSMRGSGEELYLVRSPGGAGKGELGLFTMDDGKLLSLEVLAYHSCNSRSCVQLDSWLQDVNGDGRLDIIQRKKKSRGYRRAKIKGKVLLMQADGTFRRAAKSVTPEGTYQLQAVK